MREGLSRATATRLVGTLTAYARSPFSYEALDAPIAEEARAAVARIKRLERGATVDIGRELIAVKERLPHGQFDKWVEAEFGYSKRTAVNLMQVAREIGDKYETVAHLPPTLIYRLASPSTPPQIREAIVNRAPGQYVTPASIQRVFGEVRKTEVRKARRDLRKEHAETADARSARFQAAAEKDRLRFAEAEARAAAAVDRLLDLLGEGFSDFCGVMREVDIHRFASALNGAISKHVADKRLDTGRAGSEDGPGRA